jgi:6-phosphogluconolactonase
MTRRALLPAGLSYNTCARPPAHGSASYILRIVFVCLTWATPAVCQTASQQFVFAVLPATNTTSQIVAFSKNGANGALSPVPGTPLADHFEGGPMAVDALGRFLFILNRVSNSVSLYQVDQNSGAIVEAPGSPFAVAAATAADGTLLLPICLATEASGQFLYVGYGIAGEHGIILQMVIDASNSASPQLNVSSAAPPIDVPSAPFALLVGAKGLFLYAGLSGEAVTGGYTQTNVYAITTGTGQLVQQGMAGQVNPYEVSIAIGARGKVFFDGSGVAVGALESALISPSDGTAAAVASTIALGLHNIPSAMLADSSGSFLYVRQSAGIDVYSIDATTGALSASSATTATLAFEPGQASADPEGAYIYSSQSDGMHAFQIDPQSGSLSEVMGSPFATPVSGAGWLAMSGTPIQGASGPFAAVFPASQTFGQENIGQSSDPKTISVTNTGNQALVLGGMAVQGPDAGDFSATSSCSLPAVLPPNSNTSGTCSVSVVFSPTAAGLRQGSLVFADNGPGNRKLCR